MLTAAEIAKLPQYKQDWFLGDLEIARQAQNMVAELKRIHVDER